MNRSVPDGAKFPDFRGEDLRCEVYLLDCGETAKTKANSAKALLAGCPHGLEHPGQLTAAFMAGRSGGGGDLRCLRQQVCPDYPEEADVKGVGETLARVSVQHYAVRQIAQPVVEMLPQGEDASAVGGQALCGQFGRLAKSRDIRNIFRTRTAAPFLPGAVQIGVDFYPAPDEESADSLGGIKLVAGDRQEVNLQIVYPRWDLPRRLGRIGMQYDPFFTGDCPDFGQRLDRPHFVIGVHDTDEDGLAGDGPAHCMWIDAAGAVNRQTSDCEALPLQPVERVQNRRMFDCGGNDVLPAVPVGKSGSDE